MYKDHFLTNDNSMTTLVNYDKDHHIINGFALIWKDSSTIKHNHDGVETE